MKCLFVYMKMSVLTMVSTLFLIVSNLSSYAQTPEPLVAIHVSELTQALETIPAVLPTPAGTGTTGYQWWYTSWHYFVAHESLKEALRSDGTPFIEVSDSDIAAGKLLDSDGSPRYPILISLASEAVADNEIIPLREYVNAGGFLFVGSSAFTRKPDGTTRGDFALATEMGVKMAVASLENRYLNTHFTAQMDHRLTSHIPVGTLLWSAPTNSDQIPWITYPSYNFHSPHYAWKVVAGDAINLAVGDAGPLLTVKNYGKGQVIYHGVFQPLITHGGFDPGMYAYLIYRSAIEWAFESLKLPLVKLSPWPYQYNAAMTARYDFENDQTSIRSIESSAQYEHSLGVKGDYYFSTGALREDMGGDTTVVASLKKAVSSYGATIGSHNGGLKNPLNSLLLPTDYEYWHWGPDEALDTSPAGYADGKAYAYTSILISFNDIEGWLSGVDNGRPGCGALNNCPRIWVSPFFNSAREKSREIMEELGAVVCMGEQKISPFPHKNISYTTLGKYFSSISLPTSEWYVGTDVAHSTDHGHTLDSIVAGVDFYYNLGALINFYGHTPSNDGSVQQKYITYSVTKPGVWFTNAVGVNDWWRLRSTVAVTPVITTTADYYDATVMVSGSTAADMSIEMVIPKSYTISPTVYLNGLPAPLSEYRITSSGIKIRVGSSVTNVRVHNANNQPPVAVSDSYGTNQDIVLTQAAPGLLANDTDPEGTTLTAVKVSDPANGTVVLNSNGSFSYTPVAGYNGTDSFSYQASDGMLSSNTATVTITTIPVNTTLLTDNFSRTSLYPWISQSGTWAITNNVLQGTGLKSSYSYAYTVTDPLWSDYSVEAQVQLPAGAFGGGLGGRLNPSTGAHYGAWIYPAGSLGGSNVLKLVKFSGWTSWSGTPMQQVSLPTVGTGWHTLKMDFSGSRIQVYYDGTLKIDVTDSVSPYTSGGISADLWTYTTVYKMGFDAVVVKSLAVNQAPVATGDSYSTNQNTTLTIAAPGVLANDTDPEGTTLTAVKVSDPAHGTLTQNSNGSFSYIPATGYTGSDSFAYQASDGTLVSSVATVTLTVIAVNQAPVATGDSYSTNQNTALTIAAPGVLANDTDPEGTTLTAVKVSDPAHGTLTQNSNGSFSYTPATGYSGSDSFTYQASDGTLVSNTATVTIMVIPVSTTLFTDDFTRSTLFPWISQSGSWTIASNVLQGSGTASSYSYAYTAPEPLWTDYSVEAQVQLPAGAFGGGLGGRLNPSTGAHYGAWIYPNGSLGGSNLLKLVKFRGWTSWSGTAMQQVSLPTVGTGWHTLKMVFSGSRIQVYYDGTLKIDVTDNNFDSRAPYTSGGISADMWTYSTVYKMGLDTVVVSP